jgi:acetyltransferase-like isoleucine patch superfamily enzyme
MEKFDKNKSIKNILTRPGQSSFQKYKTLVGGEISLLTFIFYEVIISILGNMPGAVGLFLRRKTYPLLFGSCGKGVIIGKNCVFRHPSKIKIGNNVTIDDNCLIDARGADEKGIVLADQVIINRGTSIQSKSGDIILGKSVIIGSNSILTSWAGLEIGEGSSIAAGCYISAGNLDTSDVTKTISEYTAYSKGPIIIESNVWIATRVTILDAVEIGRNSIVYAGSVVNDSVPQNSIVHGYPAKVIFKRR